MLSYIVHVQFSITIMDKYGRKMFQYLVTYIYMYLNPSKQVNCLIPTTYDLTSPQNQDGLR